MSATDCVKIYVLDFDPSFSYIPYNLNTLFQFLLLFLLVILPRILVHSQFEYTI